MRQRFAARIAALSPYDLATIGLLAALAVVAIATHDSYAISNDEEVQRRYGELIIAYYASGFTDRALFHYANLYLYGGLFDVLAVLTERALPFVEPYTIRHLLCALTGIAGIGAAYATARLVAGPRAGALAAFALALCGPWYGAMFNHTKDVPFAAAMMGATYFLLRAARDLPHPRQRDVIGFGIMLGAALGIRVLGFLLIGYIAAAVLVRLRRCAGSMRDRLRFFAESIVALTPAFLLGYAIMIAAWPWSALAPLNPLRGLIDFGQFHYEIRTLLAGHVYTMGDVPRWYVPTYLLIKLPLLILIGAALAITFVLPVRRGEPPTGARRSDTALLVIIAAFPVICEVIDKGPAFTGLRHFLFVVPTFAVLAGIGFDAILARCEARESRMAVGGLTAAIASLLIWNAAQLVQLHPHQYLFYNHLVGGLAGAAGRYETDYWVNIMPEAVADLEDYVARLDEAAGSNPRPYTVAVCGERLPFEKEANPRLQWTADWDHADFFIAPTHMECDKALDGRIITTISRTGARIGVVKDRRVLVQAAVARRPR